MIQSILLLSGIAFAQVEQTKVINQTDWIYGEACLLLQNRYMSAPPCTGLQQGSETPEEALKRTMYAKIRSRQEQRCQSGHQSVTPGKLISETIRRFECRRSQYTVTCSMDYESKCEAVFYEGGLNHSDPPH